MHLFSPEIGMMGTSGIVGPCMLQACGGGYSSKLMKSGNVAVAFFGDGAANNGAFHEALNMASIWKLPTLFICENNQYSMGTPLYRSLAVEDVSLRALAHGMARDRFDGDDVIRVKRRIAEAVERARVTGEPTLVEIVTYRFRGHSMSDPGLYRTKEEVEEWRRRDPLNRSRSRLLEIGMAEAAIEALEADVKAEIEDSVKFAEDSAPADAYAPYVMKGAQ